MWGKEWNEVEDEAQETIFFFFFFQMNHEEKNTCVDTNSKIHITLFNYYL